MNSVWDDCEGTMVAELSTLEANGLAKSGNITLLNNNSVHLSDCAKDMNDDEVAGWRCTISGQKYLIIND